ncbi:CAP domain-containing protein [Streptomyces sp. NPDC048623]|uniref:CAP domain-containing protein n=1 Tax=Streptomyces sp. NPDC048623 TaxID=3155761 RepID=UPI003423779B
MGRHRGTRRGAPVKTGLLGVSAAVAIGAIGIASGLLPGGETFSFDNAGKEEPRATAQAEQRAPSLNTQGGASATPAGQSADSGRAAAPAKPAPRPTPSKTATPSPKPTPPKPTPKPTQAPVTKARPAQPAAPTTEAPAVPTAVARSLSAREQAAEAEVVRLVNAERAKVGCTAVRSDAELAALAGAFSADMAARNFFDHTDPDGATPWSRAAKAGVSGLGGENIARGQVDAAAVMKSWMASDGHRANILNCDYTTLGVGVHFGSGGPWWTQDFGF